jgi:hypothetical protein
MRYDGDSDSILPYLSNANKDLERVKQGTFVEMS